MSLCSVKFVAMNLSAFHIIPAKGLPAMENPAIGVPLFGLIEATSNLGAIVAALWAWYWALLCVACNRPNTIGPATTNNPATLSNSFLLKSSLRETFLVMI